MKSKKKLIYKLHQNFNQNPYKIPDQISFRNAGVRPYDFNKLRSIRAISLRGESTEFETNKNFQERLVYNTNKLGSYEDRDHMVQQRLMGYEKRVIANHKAGVDRITQQKNIVDNQQDSQKIRLHQAGKKRSESIKPSLFRQDKLFKKNNLQQNPNQNSTGHQVNLQKNEIRPKNLTKHQRNISLPVIKTNLQSEPINKTINVIKKRQFMLTFVQEEKAKDLVMKQLGVNNSLSKNTLMDQNQNTKQKKINNQVLASIKLKSVDNLERIARSRSEVMIVDKWKQKYGQQKINKTKKLNDAISQKVVEKLTSHDVEKTFLPKLKTIQKQEDQEKKDEKVISNKQGKEQSSIVEINENIFESQQLFLDRYQDINNQKQYSSTQILPSQLDSSKKHIFCLNHYLSRQNLNNQRLKDSLPIFKQEYFSNQPLKITVTQVKKHQRKNKQNLNLQNNINTKNNLKLNSMPKFQKIDQKPVSSSETQEKLDKIIQNHRKASAEIIKQKPNEQILQMEKSNQKIKTFLSFKDFKVDIDKKQDSLQINKTKSKCSDQKILMQKIIENDVMIEWQNKRYADMEQMQFHDFVRHRVNEMNEN